MNGQFSPLDSQPSPATVERCLDTLLEGHYPPPAGLVEHGLRKVYARRQDDTDGKRTPDQSLGVMFSGDMDAWIVSPLGPEYQALLILAEAIRRDNAERPQPPDALPEAE